MLGKMAPYCTLTHNGKKYKTNGDEDGDKEPVWDDEFKLHVQNLTDDVVIRIWDQDITIPDCLGSAKVKIAKFMQNDTQINLDLFFGKKVAAIVKFNAIFEADAGGLLKYQ